MSHPVNVHLSSRKYSPIHLESRAVTGSNIQERRDRLCFFKNSSEQSRRVTRRQRVKYGICTELLLNGSVSYKLDPYIFRIRE